MTLADSLRKAIPSVQAVVGKLGLRTYRVYLHTTTWDGAGGSVGDGDAEATETEILQDGQPPPCEALTERDAKAYGLFAENGLKLGPLAVLQDGEGDINPEALRAALDDNQSFRVRVTGGENGTAGRLYKITRVHWPSSWSVIVQLEL